MLPSHIQDALDAIEACVTLRDVVLPPRFRVHNAIDGSYKTLCGRSLNGARKATSKETCFSQKCGKCEGLFDSIVNQVALGQQIARLERDNT